MNRITIALLAYGVLSAVGIVWRYAATSSPNPFVHPTPWINYGTVGSIAVGLAMGAAVALAVIAKTRWLVRRSAWARTLHQEFRDRLCPFARWEIEAFALTSGIGEEILFRGAMQISLGITLSSLCFGLVHIGPSRRFLPWTAWAVGMGFVFAFLHQASGTLVAPIVAHVAINWVNLRFIRDVGFREPSG